MNTILLHIVDQLPAIIAAIVGAWAVIHKTNQTTVDEATKTNAKVDVVQHGVDGNLDKVNTRLDAALSKIDELHSHIAATAVQTESDKVTALDKKTAIP